MRGAVSSASQPWQLVRGLRAHHIDGSTAPCVKGGAPAAAPLAQSKLQSAIPDQERSVVGHRQISKLEM